MSPLASLGEARIHGAARIGEEPTQPSISVRIILISPTVSVAVSIDGAKAGVCSLLLTSINETLTDRRGNSNARVVAGRNMLRMRTPGNRLHFDSSVLGF